MFRSRIEHSIHCSNAIYQNTGCPYIASNFYSVFSIKIGYNLHVQPVCKKKSENNMGFECLFKSFHWEKIKCRTRKVIIH